MAAKPSGPDYRMSCRASLPSGDHDDSLENFHPAATSLSAVRALAVALRRAMPQAYMRGGGVSHFSVEKGGSHVSKICNVPVLPLALCLRGQGKRIVCTAPCGYCFHNSRSGCGTGARRPGYGRQIARSGNAATVAASRSGIATSRVRGMDRADGRSAQGNMPASRLSLSGSGEAVRPDHDCCCTRAESPRV